MLCYAGVEKIINDTTGMMKRVTVSTHSFNHSTFKGVLILCYYGKLPTFDLINKLVLVFFITFII